MSSINSNEKKPGNTFIEVAKRWWSNRPPTCSLSEVRKDSGKEVSALANETGQSKTLKAGSKTYFFDIKLTKDDKPYLIITESTLKGEGEDKESERRSIFVFLENATDFALKVSSMVEQILEQSKEKQN